MGPSQFVPTSPDWDQPDSVPVAIVATGTIGRSWVVAFARAGCRVALWDPDPACLAGAATWARAQLDAKAAERLDVCQTLESCLANAVYVQESGPESIEAKQDLFAAMDRAAPPRAILASSTSTLDMTAISARLPATGRARSIVAHPVNPPHIVPVVEVLGGAETAPSVISATERFLTAVGQYPVRLNRYVPGFLLNRMQAALVREAVDLVATGVASVEAVDAVISEGLGLRWALMGPFGVANTNADGGVREYLARYGSSFEALWSDLATDVRLTPALIEDVGRAVDERYAGVPRERLRAWRDAMVVRIRQARVPVGS